MDAAASDGDHNNLYLLLVEPPRRKNRYFDDLDIHSPVRFQWWENANRIDEIPDELCHRVLEVTSLVGGVGSHRPKNPLLKLAVDEIAFGGRLLSLAASHALCGKRLRAANLPPKLAATIAQDFSTAAETLANLWIARNKPSRLQDNLHLLNSTATAYLCLL